MAERRMFAKTIIESDDFLDLPDSTQKLYFHLGMKADDDGFVNNHKGIMRTIRASDDDLKVLIAKFFVIPFESGVIVIRHWRIHNYIQKDRYKPTRHIEEMSKLSLGNDDVYNLDTECIQFGYAGKVRLGKVSIEKNKEEEKETPKNADIKKETFNQVIDEFTQYQPLREALLEFIKARKAIRKTPTTHGLKLLLTGKNGLYTLCGGDNKLAVEIVNQSISKSWQSFFPLRENNQINYSQQKPNKPYIPKSQRGIENEYPDER